MKKSKITMLVLLFLLFSCESNLDIITPEDSVGTDVILESAASISGLITGMYSQMQSGDVTGNPQLISDFMSDNVNFVGSFTSLQDIRDFQVEITNTTIDDIWIDHFRVIGAANYIINNLPTVDVASIDNFTSDDLSNAIAQAKFVRAYANFNLVNLFAQPYQIDNGAAPGIPIVLETFDTTNRESFQQPRSTVNEVHMQIEQDLLEAIAGFSSTSISSRGRANSIAAQALLARLYLYREQWADAITRANIVIDSGETALSDSYNFYGNNDSNSELIFAVVNTDTDNAIDINTNQVNDVLATFYNPTPPAGNGRGDAPFTQDLLDAYAEEPDDRRLLDLRQIATDAGNNPDATFTTKYPDALNDSADGIILRITEMYLIRAEANLRLNTTTGDTPLNDVNRLRTRAGLSDLTTVTLDNVDVERRKELCFEGHRRMDLLRTNQNLRPDGATVSAPGSPDVILPIPDDELNNNPNISN